jgi:hypothetical protein
VEREAGGDAVGVGCETNEQMIGIRQVRPSWPTNDDDDRVDR